jgi:hypothetical protein
VLRALGINSTLLGQTTGHMEQVLNVIAVFAVVEDTERKPSTAARRGGTRPSTRTRIHTGIRASQRELETALDSALTSSPKFASSSNLGPSIRAADSAPALRPICA